MVRSLLGLGFLIGITAVVLDFGLNGDRLKNIVVHKVIGFSILSMACLQNGMCCMGTQAWKTPLPMRSSPRRCHRRPDSLAAAAPKREDKLGLWRWRVLLEWRHILFSVLVILGKAQHVRGGSHENYQSGDGDARRAVGRLGAGRLLGPRRATYKACRRKDGMELTDDQVMVGCV
ncbi:hypothetical protein VPH35_065680 [Triticum aestivum]